MKCEICKIIPKRMVKINISMLTKEIEGSYSCDDMKVKLVSICESCLGQIVSYYAENSCLNELEIYRRD